MEKFLFHILLADEVPASTAERYAPPSLVREGFVHCSYRDAVRESAALYFAGKSVRVMRIDPRALDVEVIVADTPRGPMPHVHGAIPMRAVVEVTAIDDVDRAPDTVLED